MVTLDNIDVWAGIWHHVLPSFDKSIQ